MSSRCRESHSGSLEGFATGSSSQSHLFNEFWFRYKFTSGKCTDFRLSPRPHSDPTTVPVPLSSLPPPCPESRLLARVSVGESRDRGDPSGTLNLFPPTPFLCQRPLKTSPDRVSNQVVSPDYGLEGEDSVRKRRTLGLGLGVGTQCLSS